jgi:hypothetical protein
MRMEDERISKKKFLMGNFIIQSLWKNQKNKVGGRHPEGCVTDRRNLRMEETSRRQRRMGVSSEGGQGPEGAVGP